MHCAHVFRELTVKLMTIPEDTLRFACNAHKASWSRTQVHLDIRDTRIGQKARGPISLFKKKSRAAKYVVCIK